MKFLKRILPTWDHKHVYYFIPVHQSEQNRSLDEDRNLHSLLDTLSRTVRLRKLLFLYPLCTLYLTDSTAQHPGTEMIYKKG